MPVNTNILKFHILSVLSILVVKTGIAQQTSINRMAVVNRHNVVIDKIDSLSSLSVGNGGFAFTVDATGLQTSLKLIKKVCLWDAIRVGLGYL